MNEKPKKRKPYVIAVVSLFSLLVLGTVLCALSGRMRMDSTVALNGSAELHIVNHSIQGARPGEQTVYAAGHSVTRDVIQMNLYIGFPGDIRTVQFYLQNFGAVTTVVGEWNLSVPTAEQSGLVFGFPNLNGLELTPGATAGPFTITVAWDQNQNYVSGGTNNFSASIGYRCKTA